MTAPKISILAAFFVGFFFLAGCSGEQPINLRSYLTRYEGAGIASGNSYTQEDVNDLANYLAGQITYACREGDTVLIPLPPEKHPFITSLARQMEVILTRNRRRCTVCDALALDVYKHKDPHQDMLVDASIRRDWGKYYQADWIAHIAAEDMTHPEPNFLIGIITLSIFRKPLHDYTISVKIYNTQGFDCDRPQVLISPVIRLYDQRPD